MKFFKMWLAQAKITLKKVEETTGVGQTTISRWMKNDNASLKLVKKIMDGFGYTLDFEYEIPLEDNEEIYINTVSPSGEPKKNLAFMDKALIASNMTKKDLSQKIGISESSIGKWFKEDNILINKIRLVADSCGWTLKIKIYKKEQ